MENTTNTTTTTNTTKLTARIDGQNWNSWGGALILEEEIEELYGVLWSNGFEDLEQTPKTLTVFLKKSDLTKFEKILAKTNFWASWNLF